jgi:alpha-1,6-mannosyltransferase
VKILDISEFYSERGGGVRSHLETRGRLLCKLGHDHVVVAPGPSDRVSAPRETSEPARRALAAAGRIAQPTSRVVRIGGPALPYDATYHLLARFDKLGRVLREERPDIVEAHSPYLAAAAARIAGRRVARAVTTFWHADHIGAYVEPFVARALGASAARAAAAALWRGVRGLLAPFDATFVAGRRQATMLRSAGVSSVVYVPFGADTSTFHPGAASPAERLRLVGGRTSAALLVGVGRFAAEKRWDVVLDAFARVSARREAVLVLFGDGPERGRLEARAPAGVHFAGFEPDRRVLAKALASADALVHGCAYETAGLGIVEAVACALPVVVPDEGGAIDSADPASSEAYRSHDAEACAAAVHRLLDGDRDGLRARAREASRRAPTAEQHVASVASVYEDLLHA